MGSACFMSKNHTLDPRGGQDLSYPAGVHGNAVPKAFLFVRHFQGACSVYRQWASWHTVCLGLIRQRKSSELWLWEQDFHIPGASQCLGEETRVWKMSVLQPHSLLARRSCACLALASAEGSVHLCLGPSLAMGVFSAQVRDRLEVWGS